MYTILELMQNAAPNDTSNRKRVIRDTFVEFVATTLFVFSGTLSAVSTQGMGKSYSVLCFHASIKPLTLLVFQSSLHWELRLMWPLYCPLPLRLEYPS
jgi:hypothetical protein